MKPGSLVKINSPGKIYGLSNKKPITGICYGIVVEKVDMQKELTLPREAFGARVYTMGKIELFFDNDIEEI